MYEHLPPCFVLTNLPNVRARSDSDERCYENVHDHGWAAVNDAALYDFKLFRMADFNQSNSPAILSAMPASRLYPTQQSTHSRQRMVLPRWKVRFSYRAIESILAALLQECRSPRRQLRNNQQRNSGRRIPAIRKEQGDDKSQVSEHKPYISTANPVSTVGVGSRFICGNICCHESGNGRRQQMQGPMQ
jgi:hypothetical protein